MPTPSPGWNRVPRWRTRMLPGKTSWGRRAQGQKSPSDARWALQPLARRATQQACVSAATGARVAGGALPGEACRRPKAPTNPKRERARHWRRMAVRGAVGSRGARTSPPLALRPRNLGCESRPLVVEPPCFLLAKRTNTRLTALKTRCERSTACMQQAKASRSASWGRKASKLSQLYRTLVTHRAPCSRCAETRGGGAWGARHAAPARV